MIYYPMHMHLHSCHQPGASMESHIYNAKTLGMRYIRFTDHDTRVCKKEDEFRSFDFSRGETEYVYSGEEYVRLVPSGNYEPHFESGNFVLHTDGESEADKLPAVTLYTSGKNHTYSLLSGVTLTLGLRYKIEGTARIIIDIKLSQRPPEHKHAHLRYVIGEINNNEELVREIAIKESRDGLYRFNISADMEKFPEMGGLDNAFDTVSVILDAAPGNECDLALSRLDIDYLYSGDEVLKRQRTLAKTIGEKYGVYPFVTSEISGAGQHKNIFSECVPLIEYEKYDYKLSEAEAIDWVKSNGGIFAYNHPFENNRFKKKQFTREDIERIIKEESETLTKSNVLGATLMEVGFPMGRGLFTLGDYLALWDNLSMAGVFITGCGDSDSHYSHQGWFEGNNFATYAGLEDYVSYPAPESEITKSYKSGNVYMGDPTMLHTDVSFTSGDAWMGGVIRIAQGKKRSFELRFSDIEKGSRVRIIGDGRSIIERVAERDGEFAEKFEFCLSGYASFVRCELYAPDGKCILLTNPIYLVSENFAKEKIPAERFHREYEPIIPEGVKDIKGTKLLHISDTDSRMYSYYKKLFEAVKPDIILHTGDMADEVKVGRMPETREEYLYKSKKMIGILKDAGARVIIVPGNNDLPDEIKRLAPFAEVYPRDTIIEIDGEECRISHEVHKITYDKKWHFYGHGYTGEEWNLEKNVPGAECRFNACECTYVVSISENKYFLIDNPEKF